MSGNQTSRLCKWGALFALVLLAFIVAPARSTDSATDIAPQIHSAPAAVPISLPVAADRFGWFWSFLETTLHNRTRMVQFGVIGMCIALYFMFRARG